MIAYNKEWLKNLVIREEAGSAFHEYCIEESELNAINNKYSIQFYTPQYFIAVGLFLLTIIILFFSFGVLALLFIDSFERIIGGLAIFFGMLTYAGLEYMIQTKKHYRSGVDDALLWMAAISISGGVIHLTGSEELISCVIVFIICLYGVLRFTDRLMAVAAYVCLMGVFYYSFTGMGVYGKMLAPFALMAVSAIVYFVATIIKNNGTNNLYNECLQVSRVIALLGFYCAGNYYVVREISDEMLHLNLQDNQSIPFAWLFWICTVTIPVVYLLAGIQRKDKMWIRTGLVLMVAAVLTIKYYYYVAAVETIMTLGGIALLGIVYGLSQYLKKPRFGFTGMDSSIHDKEEKMQVESLVISETFSAKPEAADVTRFGGGGFGGGGSSSDF